MWKKIILIAAIVIIVPIAAILAYASTQPDEFRVQRSASIKAPPQKIFPYLNDFRRSVEWSPYEKMDPDMKRVYSGAPIGKGAIYEWDGDKNIGAGRLEIIDAAPPSKLTYTLDFSRPFEAHNIVDFTLDEKGGATEVTWAMHGPMPLISKVMCLFFNMDKMVGGDFEKGLANLKTLAEG